MNTDESIEKEIVEKGLTHPRVTLSDLEANIESIDIVEYKTRGGSILRWAVINTTNGFSVTGRPSASVSPENDNAEIGEKVAIENARQELWLLMGYALKESLAKAKAKADGAK